MKILKILGQVLFLSLFGSTVFAEAPATFTGANVEDDCSVYGAKAVACHNAGHLADAYDQAGIGCGKVPTQSFWKIDSSSNPEVGTWVFDVDTLSLEVVDTPYGKVRVSGCYVEVRTPTNGLDSLTGAFLMKVSVGLEDNPYKSFVIVD